MKYLTLLLLAGMMAISSFATASNRMFEVTITNITKGQSFTPILVASTHHGFKFFELGKLASDDLQHVAEAGDTDRLKEFLLFDGIHALDVQTTGGLLAPGDSVTLRIKRNNKYNHISIVSMLIPTNDAFFGITRGNIKRHGITTFTVPAYDAGTEMNDEKCTNIPGPVCNGEGYNVTGGEGFIHIHQGIQGNGDITGADHDWKNPVALISIKRMN